MLGGKSTLLLTKVTRPTKPFSFRTITLSLRRELVSSHRRLPFRKPVLIIGSNCSETVEKQPPYGGFATVSDGRVPKRQG